MGIIAAELTHANIRDSTCNIQRKWSHLIQLCGRKWGLPCILHCFFNRYRIKFFKPSDVNELCGIWTVNFVDVYREQRDKGIFSAWTMFFFENVPPFSANFESHVAFVFSSILRILFFFFHCIPAMSNNCSNNCKVVGSLFWFPTFNLLLKDPKIHCPSRLDEMLCNLTTRRG